MTCTFPHCDCDDCLHQRALVLRGSIPSTPDQSGEPTAHLVQQLTLKVREDLYAVAQSGGASDEWWLRWSAKLLAWIDKQRASSLAPSGESGVPKCPSCGTDHDPSDTVTHTRALTMRAVGQLASTPPVSSPEKPKLCAICGTIAVMRYGTPGMDLCGEHAPAFPAPGIAVRLIDDEARPTSTIAEVTLVPTDEEVERLDIDALIVRHGLACGELAQTVMNSPNHASKWKEANDARQSLRDAIASLHRDLEEARKEIDHATQIAKAALDDGSTDVQFHTVGEWMAALWRSRNLWKSSFETAERERDEARKAQSDTAHLYAEQLDRAEEAERERDWWRSIGGPERSALYQRLDASRSIHPTQTD